jgi:hypothetical protein
VRKVLGLPKFDKSHDAKAHAELVDAILASWGLDKDKVSYAVTDNTNTMKAMVRDYFSQAAPYGRRQRSCFEVIRRGSDTW